MSLLFLGLYNDALSTGILYIHWTMKQRNGSILQVVGREFFRLMKGYKVLSHK